MYLRFSESFFEFANRRSKNFLKITNHFKKLDFNYLDFFKNMIENFFFGFFRLPVCIFCIIKYNLKNKKKDGFKIINVIY